MDAIAGCGRRYSGDVESTGCYNWFKLSEKYEPLYHAGSIVCLME